VSAVLLHLIIDRFRTVRVDHINYPIRDEPQILGPLLLGVFGQLLLGSRNLIRVQVGTGEFLHGPFHHPHMLDRHRIFTLCSSQISPTGAPRIRRSGRCAAQPRQRRGPARQPRLETATTSVSTTSSSWRSSAHQPNQLASASAINL
jgi:hypothetical protein